MSDYLTLQFGYVCSGTPAELQRLAYVAFTWDGIDYPQDWLDTATPATFAAIGAIPKPAFDPLTEQVIQMDYAWVIAPLPPDNPGDVNRID